MLIIEYYAAVKHIFSKTPIAKLMCYELHASCVFSKFSVRYFIYIILCYFCKKQRVCPNTGDSVTQYLQEKQAYN